MKKSLILFLNLGYWITYILIILIIFAGATSGRNGPALGEMINVATSVGSNPFYAN